MMNLCGIVEESKSDVSIGKTYLDHKDLNINFNSNFNEIMQTRQHHIDESNE